jgi:hypothetical protein
VARLFALIAALAGGLLLAVVASRPPAPLPIDAASGLFAAGRAMVDIAAIARAPHPTGSDEDARVRAYLVGRLQALGLTVETQAAPLSDAARARLVRWGERPAAEARAVNVIGVLPGRDRSAPAVLLMAHHDTVAGSPGAADDSAGVAAILETLRALRSDPPRERDLIVLFTDAEELKSDGAAGFFRDHPLARRIGAVINLEARGGGGRALMFETGSGDGPMMALFARAVRRPSANSTAVLVYRLLPNITDFSIPKAAGTAGFNFAFLGRPGLYHAPQATPAAIDPGSVQHIGAQTLDLVRALAQTPTLPPRGPDAVFCDLLGIGLIAYPAWGGWVVVAAAAGLLVFAAARVGAAGLLTAAGTLRGAAMSLGVVLTGGGLLQLANGASGAGAGANYYDRLAAIPRLELQALLIALAVLCLASVGRRREARLWSGWLGIAVFVLMATIAVQAAAPAAAPVLAWPLLLGAGAAALAARVDKAVRSAALLAALAVVGAIGVGQSLGLAHFAFLGVGQDLPGAMAVFLAPVMLILWPLLCGTVSRRVAIGLAAALLVAGFGLAIRVRLDPPAPTIPVYARTP